MNLRGGAILSSSEFRLTNLTLMGDRSATLKYRALSMLGSQLRIRSRMHGPDDDSQVAFFNLTACTGYFNPAPSRFSANINIFGGQLQLLSHGWGTFGPVYVYDNASISFDDDLSESGATLGVSASLYLFNSSEIVLTSTTAAITGYLVMNDDSRFRLSASFVGNNSKSSGSSGRPLQVLSAILHETQVIVDFAPRPEELQLLSFKERLSGRFRPEITVAYSSAPNSTASVAYQVSWGYHAKSVTFYLHSQSWPSFGWYSLLIILAAAVFLVVAIVLISRNIAVRFGAEDVWLLGSIEDEHV